MFIRLIDEALERLIREELPMPAELGDVSFDPPTGSWGAQLSRLTVNLYLYNVVRSTHPSRSAVQRTTPDGRGQQRRLLPMVQLDYLASAWAGSPRDEHQLLGDVIDRVSGLSALAPEYFTTPVESTVSLTFTDDPGNRPRELWSSLGGSIKPSFVLQVTVAADAFGWEEQAPRVERIAALTHPVPEAANRT